jgi:sodium-coupled monocarboxylate transporter 8/12
MNNVDYFIIGAYLLGLLVLGFYFKNQQGKSDYFLGGRSIGWKPLSLSIMATQLSAVSFISAPAFVGLREGGGLIWLSYEIALPIAMLLLLWLVLPYLHSTGVISVYDFLEKRFGFSTRLLLSVVFQISRSFATAIMIYAVSIILQGAIGLAFWQSIVCIGVITVIYSLQGGMKAVVYGDALQMLVIILGALGCLAFGLYHIGGVSHFLTLVDTDRLQAIDFQSTGFNGDGFGFWPMLFGGIVLYASYYGCDQSEAQRSLAAKNTQDLKKMIMAASFLRFPITLIYCSAGLVIGTLAVNTPEFLDQIPANNPDWMMPIFIVNYMPNGVIGLLLVAILAAAMSSLSSAINSLSAVSVEDYCRFTKTSYSTQEYMLKARFAGICWGIITLTLAFFAGDIAPTVIEAINKVGSVFYGPIFGCFLLAFASAKIHGKHVNIGLLLGVSINIILWLFAPNIFWFWYNLIGFTVTITSAYLLMLINPVKQNLRAPTLYTTKHNPLNWVDASLMTAWSIAIILMCIQLPNWLS